MKYEVKMKTSYASLKAKHVIRRKFDQYGTLVLCSLCCKSIANKSYHEFSQYYNHTSINKLSNNSAFMESGI